LNDLFDIAENAEVCQFNSISGEDEGFQSDQDDEIHYSHVKSDEGDIEVPYFHFRLLPDKMHKIRINKYSGIYWSVSNHLVGWKTDLADVWNQLPEDGIKDFMEDIGCILLPDDQDVYIIKT